MKKVYWHIQSASMHSYKIEFWTKEDRSNAITTTMVTLDNEKLRNKVAHLTGSERFELVQVKQEKGR